MFPSGVVKLVEVRNSGKQARGYLQVFCTIVQAGGISYPYSPAIIFPYLRVRQLGDTLGDFHRKQGS